MALSKERERKQYLQVFLKQYTSEFPCIVESRKRASILRSRNNRNFEAVRHYFVTVCDYMRHKFSPTDPALPNAEVVQLKSLETMSFRKNDDTEERSHLQTFPPVAELKDMFFDILTRLTGIGGGNSADLWTLGNLYLRSGEWYEVCRQLLSNVNHFELWLYTKVGEKLR
ncbi:hypothetical protein MTO96_004362 [Rhipicephalus appendiculatus]